MSTDKRQVSALVLVGLGGCCASILMFWMTVYGPGVSPDSVTYIETARSLLTGNGFSAAGQPMTHYPPVYPLLLAISAFFQDGDVLQGGRLLGALLFGTNLVLFGLAVFICTERNLLATGCAICFFLVSAPIIKIHSMAWSEAPFITFALAAWILLSFHVVRPSLYLLLAGSLSVGCAMATRYVGVTLLPSMVCGLLFFGNRPPKHRIGDAFLAATVASLPLASWLVRNIVTAGTATNRPLSAHVFGFQHAKQLISTMYNFFLPMSIPDWIKAFPLGIAAALFLVSVTLLYRNNYIRHNVNTFRIVLPAICIIFFLTYILFLVISISFFDAQTPLSHRILLPAFIGISVAGISLAWSLSSAFQSRMVWYVFVFFVFLSVAFNSHRAMAVAVDIHTNGSGYTARQWQDSKTISFVNSLTGDMKIYSNVEDTIQFLTGRTAIGIPSVTSAVTLKHNRDFEAQLQVMCNEVGEGEAVVVYLNSVIRKWYLLTLKELLSRCDMPVLSRLDDGVILGRSRRKTEQGSALGLDSAVWAYTMTAPIGNKSPSSSRGG